MDRFRRSLVHTNYIEMDAMVKDAGKDTRPILNFDIEKWQTWCPRPEINLPYTVSSGMSKLVGKKSVVYSRLFNFYLDIRRNVFKCPVLYYILY